MNQPTETKPGTLAERHYVPAADVARACGLTEFALDTRYRPDDWASPRDFYFDGRSNHYAVLSLYVLADELVSQGMTDAAVMLRAWIARIPKSSPAQEEPALIRVPHVEATEEELDRVAGNLARRHPSDREPRPHWTELHDE